MMGTKMDGFIGPAVTKSRRVGKRFILQGEELQGFIQSS
jgi:hypothetical protein